MTDDKSESGTTSDEQPTGQQTPENELSNTAEPTETPADQSDEQNQSEQRVVDDLHYARIPAVCPRCPEDEGDLEMADSSVFGPERVAIDVTCNACEYEGSAIMQLIDFEDHNNEYESAVKNDDVDVIYESY